MGLERYVVDAVVLEGRSPTEIARLHGISRSRREPILSTRRHRSWCPVAVDVVRYCCPYC